MRARRTYRSSLASEVSISSGASNVNRNRTSEGEICRCLVPLYSFAELIEKLIFSHRLKGSDSRHDTLDGPSLKIWQFEVLNLVARPKICGRW